MNVARDADSAGASSILSNDPQSGADSRAIRTACSGLGPDTVAAIDEVAYEHPDADADCIASAYDAFEREHGT